MNANAVVTERVTPGLPIMNAVGSKWVRPGLPRINLAVNVNFNHFSETRMSILVIFITFAFSRYFKFAAQRCDPLCDS